jgi:hypothetical protein
MQKKARVSLVFLILLCVVGLNPGVLAGIANPDFEIPPPWPIPFWLTLGNPGEAPPFSSGVQCARLEPTLSPWGPGFPAGGGFVGSSIFQEFTCDPAHLDKCYILFDYGHFNGGGALAAVCVDGPAGPLWGILPALAPWVTVLVIYPACDSLKIFFGIVQPGAAVASNLYVDNIRDTCCLTCIDTTGILVLELDESPPADPAGASISEMFGRVSGTRVPAAQPWAVYIIIFILIATGTYVVLRKRALKLNNA